MIKWAVIPALALMIGCSEAVPESASPATLELTRLREPDVRCEPTPLRLPDQTKRHTMKPVRCAIYTRKSSEEGLEQDFNSLDAQHAACSAYVASQASEGWTCINARIAGRSVEYYYAYQYAECSWRRQRVPFYVDK